MTEMRDARLQKALQEAPDAHVRPAPQVAESIRAAARNALPAPPPPVASSPWWQRLWHSTARPAAPWSAAFATLLVSVLVTVMWVRDPVLETRPVADSAPASTASIPAAEPAAAAKVPLAEQARSAVAKKAPPPSAQAPAAAQASLPEPAQAANKATASDAAELADAQSRTSRPQKEASAEALSSRADTARAAARPAPAVVAAPAPAPAPMARAGADTSGLEAWTGLQVQMSGGSATVDRVYGQRLFAAMVRLARQLPPANATAPATPATVPALRLTVMAQGETLAVMVLRDSTVLWQRPAQDDLYASVSAGDIQTLLQLARQVLGAEPAN